MHQAEIIVLLFAVVGSAGAGRLGLEFHSASAGSGVVFIVIGLQLPGILHALDGESLMEPFINGLLISGVVILVRIA